MVACGGWNGSLSFKIIDDMILGEEQTLLLMGTGGLKPMVALALLSLFCVAVCFVPSLALFVSSVLLNWAMFICNLVWFYVIVLMLGSTRTA